jgi:predicted esterase
MSLADEAGLVLLAPESRGTTWDVLRGGYGPDVAFIDRALEQTFGRYAVDPRRLAVGGFSDGASYALSLGITNGDLFGHVLAFSPGFMAPGGRGAGRASSSPMAPATRSCRSTPAAAGSSHGHSAPATTSATASSTDPTPSRRRSPARR